MYAHKLWLVNKNIIKRLIKFSLIVLLQYTHKFTDFETTYHLVIMCNYRWFYLMCTIETNFLTFLLEFLVDVEKIDKFDLNGMR